MAPKIKEHYKFSDEQEQQMREQRAKRLPWSAIAANFGTTPWVVRRLIEEKPHKPPPRKLLPLEFSADHFAVDVLSFRLITGREPRYDN